MVISRHSDGNTLSTHGMKKVKNILASRQGPIFWFIRLKIMSFGIHSEYIRSNVRQKTRYIRYIAVYNIL